MRSVATALVAAAVGVLWFPVGAWMDWHNDVRVTCEQTADGYWWNSNDIHSSACKHLN